MGFPGKIGFAAWPGRNGSAGSTLATLAGQAAEDRAAGHVEVPPQSGENEFKGALRFQGKDGRLRRNSPGTFPP